MRVRRLPGATSSVVHELTIVDPTGGARRFALRRYADPRWAGDGAHLVTREVQALSAARSAPIPAPELVAADPTGDHAGKPALLMTRLAGRPRVTEGHGWLDGLGEVHDRMAAWEVAAGKLPIYAPWFPPHPEPPRWSPHQDAWARAIDLVTGPTRPVGDVRPIHRDLHPANILFHRGVASAVVDWANACVGPIESDLARCRANLAMLVGIEAADGFLLRAGDAARSYDPAWDLVVCVELLPDPSAVPALIALGATTTLRRARAALDEMVVRALAARS